MRLLYGLLAAALLCINILYFVPMPQRVNDYFLAQLEDQYGSKKCDEHLEKFIRDLADAYGIDNESFVIRCANTNFMSQFNYANAGVMACSFSWLPISCHRYIFFAGKDFIEELSLEQKTFLISHELMHIKNNDHANANYLLLSLYILGLILVLTLVSDTYRKHINLIDNYPFITIIGGMALSALIVLLARGTYSKFYEKRADVQACECIGSAQGGISFINHLHKNYKKTHLRAGMLVTHPSNQDRINYLQQLQKTFKS